MTRRKLNTLVLTLAGTLVGILALVAAVGDPGKGNHVPVTSVPQTGTHAPEPAPTSTTLGARCRSDLGQQDAAAAVASTLHEGLKRPPLPASCAGVVPTVLDAWQAADTQAQLGALA